MSRLSAATCPLSDCTLAVNNAENINLSAEAVFQSLKSTSMATPRARALLRSVKAISHSTDAKEVVPSSRRERVSTSTRNVRSVVLVRKEETTDVAPSNPTQEMPPSSSLINHIFAKPFTPAAMPRRNNPYAPCLLESSLTPEDAFYACYSDAESTEAASAPHTPVRTRTWTATATIPAATLTLLESLCTTTGSSAQCTPLMGSPVKSEQVVVDSLLNNSTTGATSGSLLFSSPERGAASPRAPQSDSTRIVRKIVCCGVDRTSGRPVPKFKE